MAETRIICKEKGSVLVMVLWVLALLTMIVAYYSSQVKIMRNASQYLFASIQGKEAAMSVLRLVAKYLEDTRSEDKASGDLVIHPQVLYTTYVGGMAVSFFVENEAGKIDLNRADEGLLRDFLRYMLGEENPIQADTITDGILDWKDKDKLTRMNGAEDNVYMDKNPPYHAANAPFKTVDELRLVNGIWDRLFFGPMVAPNIPEGWQGGLRDLFTIYGLTGYPNPDYAPAPIKAFMEDRAVEGTDKQSSIWLLKVYVGHRVYRLYFSLQAKEPGFSLKFYTEDMGH